MALCGHFDTVLLWRVASSKGLHIVTDIRIAGGAGTFRQGVCLVAAEFHVCGVSGGVFLLQSFMFAVYEEAEQNIQNATGPIDDGYITNVVGALPGDALCCSGPEALDDGTPHMLLVTQLPSLTYCA